MYQPAQNQQLVTHVFSKLDCPTLAKLKQVSKAWKELSENEGIVQQCFRNTWKFKRTSGQWWAINDLMNVRVTDFVKVHKVSPHDSIMGLALKYNTATMSIRILNNLVSDNSIKAHAALYVPITEQSEIQDKVIKFITQPDFKRRMVLVFDEEDADDEEIFPKINPEALKELQVITVQRALKLDQATARFYLEENGYNFREAVAAYRSDEEWYQVEGYKSDDSPGPDTWYRRFFPILACGLPYLCRPTRGRYTRIHS
eukprot:TRINITY_DN1914_c0_g1_i1.p2 TRINITY_DN1914_c0_g1~~TRINITY_DN1914_c0_g1_i1.p2  ORF type:complete len:257 (-),score=31.23 TRINITY_DN1914_c0_g1_i1:496-1266(-)